ncbi:MAG: hypothetical protein ABI082_14670 [Dokdonella sp.]
MLTQRRVWQGARARTCAGRVSGDGARPGRCGRRPDSGCCDARRTHRRGQGRGRRYGYAGAGAGGARPAPGADRGGLGAGERGPGRGPGRCPEGAAGAGRDPGQAGGRGGWRRRRDWPVRGRCGGGIGGTQGRNRCGAGGGQCRAPARRRSAGRARRTHDHCAGRRQGRAPLGACWRRGVRTGID